MPLVSASAAPVYAAELAAAAYRAGNLVDEAPLIQLLQHCSGSLGKDIPAPAAATAPAPAQASAGSDRATELAAGSAAASAASGLSCQTDAADSQPSAISSQSPVAAVQLDQGSVAHPAGWPSATQPDGDMQQPPQQHIEQPPPEWESQWALTSATVLQVQHLS